jgi:hypothetical protein
MLLLLLLLLLLFNFVGKPVKKCLDVLKLQILSHFSFQIFPVDLANYITVLNDKFIVSKLAQS